MKHKAKASNSIAARTKGGGEVRASTWELLAVGRRLCRECCVIDPQIGTSLVRNTPLRDPADAEEDQ